MIASITMSSGGKLPSETLACVPAIACATSTPVPNKAPPTSPRSAPPQPSRCSKPASTPPSAARPARPQYAPEEIPSTTPTTAPKASGTTPPTMIWNARGRSRKSGGMCMGAPPRPTICLRSRSYQVRAVRGCPLRRAAPRVASPGAWRSRGGDGTPARAHRDKRAITAVLVGRERVESRGRVRAPALLPAVDVSRRLRRLSREARAGEQRSVRSDR